MRDDHFIDGAISPAQESVSFECTSLRHIQEEDTYIHVFLRQAGHPQNCPVTKEAEMQSGRRCIALWLSNLISYPSLEPLKHKVTMTRTPCPTLTSSLTGLQLPTWFPLAPPTLNSSCFAGSVPALARRFVQLHFCLCDLASFSKISVTLL